MIEVPKEISRGTRVVGIKLVLRIGAAVTRHPLLVLERNEGGSAPAETNSSQQIAVGGVVRALRFRTVLHRISREPLLLTILLPVFSVALYAQAPAGKPPDPLNRESPQSCVFSFLEACHSRDYARAWKYLDLRKLSADARFKNGPQLALQLGQILDRDARFDIASLSREPGGDSSDGLASDRERVDSFIVSGKALELQLERVPLRSGVSIWLFSSDSVERIPQLAQLLTDSPIEKRLPEPLVSWKLIDTSLWRWIALFLLIGATAALSRLLAQVVLVLASAPLQRFGPHINRQILQVFAGPLRLLFAVAIFRAGMEWIGPSALLRLWLERSLALLFFLGLGWLSTAVVDHAIGRLRSVLAARHNTFTYSVLPLFSRILKITIMLLMIAAVLSDWGYNTTAILAGLGVGGVAIALAAQKTIENLFGGVAVISDRPVAVGDFCRFGDRVGTVEDIGLRSTRIRSLERTLVTVPNAQFSSMTLENFSQRDKVLFHFTLNLRRDTSPSQVRVLLDSITKTLKEHSKVESGHLPVRFVGVGSYSLDLEVFAYILTRDFDEFLQVQQELLLWILDAVEAAGTALALPTQANISYAFGSVPNENGARTPTAGPPST
jgi:MscS family membrane protein